MYADAIWYVKINVSETKYLKYPQNIEGNGSFRMVKCGNYLSSLAYAYIFSMFVFYWYTVVCIQHHAIGDKEKTALIVYKYANVIWDLHENKYVSETKYLKYYKILKEIAV